MSRSSPQQRQPDTYPEGVAEEEGTAEAEGQSKNQVEQNSVPHQRQPMQPMIGQSMDEMYAIASGTYRGMSLKQVKYASENNIIKGDISFQKPMPFCYFWNQQLFSPLENFLIY